MASVPVGDVVFVRFPFSDLSQVKLRPALVLANAGRGDTILCQITSRPYGDRDAIRLEEASFTQGHLIKISYVRPAKLFTANRSIIQKSVASVEPVVRRAVVNRINEILSAT
jgi:mRNA interferase MazF